MKKVKGQTPRMRKITNNVSDKVLISKIHKDLITATN